MQCGELISIEGLVDEQRNANAKGHFTGKPTTATAF